MIKAIVFDAYGTLYDVQSVGNVIDAAFPGHGEYITQVWRLKQLEYSWLRSMMDDYADFWAVTREALHYTLGTLGLRPADALFEEIAEAYNRLLPYPDAEDALIALSGHRLAILSNGSTAMLDALVRNSGLERHFDGVFSVDAKRVYKPDMRSYELVEEKLGAKPSEVLFVSSNGFDVAGAKCFGFRVARIERLPATILTQELAEASSIGPHTMFKALRLQEEAVSQRPDFIISSLSLLPNLVEGLDVEQTAYTS